MGDEICICLLQKEDHAHITNQFATQPSNFQEKNEHRQL